MIRQESHTWLNQSTKTSQQACCILVPMENQLHHEKNQLPNQQQKNLKHEMWMVYWYFCAAKSWCYYTNHYAETTSSSTHSQPPTLYSEC